MNPNVPFDTNKKLGLYCVRVNFPQGENFVLWVVGNDTPQGQKQVQDHFADYPKMGVRVSVSGCVSPDGFEKMAVEQRVAARRAILHQAQQRREELSAINKFADQCRVGTIRFLVTFSDGTIKPYDMSHMIATWDESYLLAALEEFHKGTKVVMVEEDEKFPFDFIKFNVNQTPTSWANAYGEAVRKSQG